VPSTTERTSSRDPTRHFRWFRFDAPDKRRPVLVLGRQESLHELSQIPVIPLSTHARGLPWEVTLTAADGLPTECVLKPEWIKSVDRVLVGPRIGTLPEARWTEVRSAILVALGFALE
jgi:mRNA interferase MazF